MLPHKFRMTSSSLSLKFHKNSEACRKACIQILKKKRKKIETLFNTGTLPIVTDYDFHFYGNLQKQKYAEGKNNFIHLTVELLLSTLNFRTFVKLLSPLKLRKRLYYLTLQAIEQFP